MVISKQDENNISPQNVGDISTYHTLLWVYNHTVNNISVVLWRSVVLVVETGKPREIRRFAASHKLYHIILY